MTQPQSSFGYVDQSYLHSLADQLRHFKIMSYERMHLQPGHHVLDLGCGPASDTLALAELVGETGRVVGVDYDPEMIAAAQQKAEAAGVSDHVIHEVQDATQLPYEDNTFDACRSERVFQHLPDPDQALAELVRVTKPGGWIVITDADWGSMIYYSLLPDLEAKVKAVYRDRISLHPIIGRQLHHMMHRLHLAAVTFTPGTWSLTDFKTTSYLTSLENKIQPRGLEGGYFTQDEFDRFVTDLKQLDAEGNFFAYVCGVITAGQKPA